MATLIVTYTYFAVIFLASVDLSRADLEDYLVCYEHFKVMSDDLFGDLSNNPEKFNSLFNEVICTHELDYEKCKAGLETWWPRLSPIIFTLETSDLLTQTICYKDSQVHTE